MTIINISMRYIVSPRGSNPNMSIVQRGSNREKRQQTFGRLGPETLGSRGRVLTYRSQRQIPSITL